MEKIKLNESETVEFKRSTSELKEALVSISAILNKHQKGEIYFGVKNDGTIIGQDISERTIRDRSKAIADGIEPRIYPKINKLEIYGKSCISVDFLGEETPYYAYGRSYIRVGDENRVLSAKGLENFILKKNRDKLRWDNQVCKSATLEDIDNNAIKKFIELTRDSNRINISNENKEKILKNLNLIRDNQLTNAAIILFGKKPYEFFNNAVVKCGRFRGVTKEEFINMKDFEGNLFECLDKSISFLKEHLRLSAKIEELYRKEKWEIPIEALREVVINALIHRDYFSAGFIYIKVYDSDIVIANPGKLPDKIKIKDLYKEHESLPNNPLIARAFYYTGLIDVWGRGILNIIKFLNAEGIDKPKFEESGGSFRIVFSRPKPVIVETTQKTTQKILDLMQKNPKITREEIAKLLSLTPDGVKYNLTVLKKQGKLKRIGGRKEGYWKVLEK